SINDAGDIVGESTVTGPHSHGWIYSNGSMTDLGTLGGAADSGAFGINNLGQITGQASTSSNRYHTYLYSNGSMSDLGALGGNDSFGRAVNNVGQVAGYSFTTGNNPPSRLSLFDREYDGSRHAGRLYQPRLRHQ